MKFKLLASWKFKALAITTILLLSFVPIHAQTSTIKGVITGDGEPLPGVTVLVKGTANGVVTDFDGNYEIKAKKGDKLMFTYVGFKSQEITVGSKLTINVVLITNVAALDEVVVIGYGTQTKKEVTGAVAKVKAEELSRIATADIGTALQGQVAGVNVTASSGDPGAESNVQIRGLTSINGGNRPLYVVDGIPFEGDPKLSVSEIETIDVLKDAASAAIYGTRGAAGVILVTTKKGKAGIMKVNVNSYYGVQSITSGTPLQNTEQRLYTTFLQSAALSDRHYGNTWTTIERSPHQLTNNTSLVNFIENDFAPIQNHSVNVSGGKDGLSYSINGNLFKQEGVLIKSAYERFNVRANTQYKKGKWRITTGLSMRVEDRKYAPWGLLREAIRYSPMQPELANNLESLDGAGEGSFADNLSYLGYRLIQEDDREGHYFDASLIAAYDFSRDLKFTTRMSASFDNGTRKIINPKFVAFNDLGEEIPSQRSRVRNESSLAKKTTWENILNYKKSFGDHNLNFTAVFSAERYSYSQFFAEKYDLVSNDITVLNGATLDPNVGSGTNRWTWDRENTLLGMLGRVQYNYRGKYLLGGSIRRDGSSRFVKQPYGVFPSFSLGWNVSDEDFWDPIRDVAPKFKMRMSQGTTGNQNIADYSYAATIALEHDYVLGAGDDQNMVLGASQANFANPLVKWETSVSTNTGFDVSFLNNALTVSGDYYVTNKKDMLFPVILPPTAGGGANSEVTLNVGDMRNQGIEYAINYKHKGKFSWNTQLTYTRNENTITKMSGSNKIIYFDDSSISGHSNDQDLISALAEGYEAGAFFLMKTDGTIQSQSELDDYLVEFPNSGAKLGDLKYVNQVDIDENENGTIDEIEKKIDINDRVYSGSGTPEFEMGWNFNGYYKGFDFSMQLYGSFGGEIMNGNKALAYKSNTHEDLVYQWTPQSNTSFVPVNRGPTHDNYRGYSDYWLEDGTFVRLRNISIGYTIPKRKIEKIGLSRLRVYVAGQNLLTFTKYTGYDPEVGNNGLSTRGIDKGIYPVSSQIRAGLQLQF